MLQIRHYQISYAVCHINILIPLSNIATNSFKGSKQLNITKKAKIGSNERVATNKFCVFILVSASHVHFALKFFSKSTLSSSYNLLKKSIHT